MSSDTVKNVVQFEAKKENIARWSIVNVAQLRF